MSGQWITKGSSWCQLDAMSSTYYVWPIMCTDIKSRTPYYNALLYRTKQCYNLMSYSIVAFVYIHKFGSIEFDYILYKLHLIYLNKYVI